MTIFGHHMYSEHYPKFTTTDTMFAYFQIGLDSKDLGELLSDSAGGIEKAGYQSGTVWKNGVKYDPKRSTVNENLVQEFNRFRTIFSYRNRESYYVVFYKKHMIESILR